MLTAEQLDVLVRGVSGASAPMWRAEDRVVYLGSPGGDPDYWEVGLEGGEGERITSGLQTVVLDRMGESHISPDGSWLAYVSAAADTTGENLELEIWLCPLSEEGEPRRLTALGARISSFSWSPDGRWVAVSSNRYGSFDVFLVSVPDGQTHRLTCDEHHEVYPSFAADSERVLYVRLNDAWTNHTIYSVDLRGADERLVVADEDFFDYHCGREFGYPLADPRGRWVAFRSYRSGWINYWRVSPDGGSPEPMMEASADQRDGAWSPDGRFFAYIENHRGNLQLRTLDVQNGSVEVLDGDGGGACSLPAWSPDGSRLAYLYQELAQPVQLRVADTGSVGNGQARERDRRVLVGPEHPEWLSELVTPERVSYRSFDGRIIDAFLYRPSGAGEGGRKHPALILAHGGPTSQFYETFEHQGTFTSAQYLAQRGYILLLPNVRGSSGYGREFEDLNNRDWGHGDLEDVAHGVRFLKQLEEVDSSAIGIYGASYGGSMVMSAVAFKPGLFQAGVVFRSGYGDWLNSYTEMQVHHVKMLHYELGPMPENAHIYRRSSPFYEISRIRTPTMIIHSERRPPFSPRVRRYAEEYFAEEMKRLMKPVRHRVFEGRSAWKADGRRQLLREVGEYLDEYLKGSLASSD